MPEVYHHLAHLETMGLVRLAQLVPEIEYLFRHALVQEATYDSLLKNDRRKLHQMVGDALEAAYPDRLAELAPQLAVHFYEAGDDARALHYHTLAAETALDRCANVEAETHFQAALHITGFRSARAELLSGLGEAYARQSHHEDAVATWKESSELYLSMGDEDHAAQTLARAAWALWQTGDAVVSLRLCEDALKRLEGGAESKGLAALLHEAARIYYFNGAAETALPLCHRALSIAERLGDDETHAASLNTMGVMMGGRGETEEAKMALRGAIAIAERKGLLFQAARANNNLGSLLAETIGDQAAGRDHFRRAAEINHRRGSPYEELFCLGNLAETLLKMGEFGETEEVLSQMRGLMQSSGRGLGLLSLHQLEAYLPRYRGAFDLAEDGFRQCLKMAREVEDLQIIGHSSALLADMLIEIGRASETPDLLRESIEIGETGLGAGRIWPRTLQAAALIAQGHLDAAQATLTEAHQAAGSDATPWDQAWLRLAEARLARATDSPHAASLYEATVVLQQQMGVRWYRAKTLLEWGSIAALREAANEFNAMHVPHYAHIAQERINILMEESPA